MRKSTYMNIEDGSGITPRFTRIEGVCRRYGVGRNTALKIAHECGAKVKYGNISLYDIPTLDKAFDAMLAAER